MARVYLFTVLAVVISFVCMAAADKNCKNLVMELAMKQCSGIRGKRDTEAVEEEHAVQQKRSIIPSNCQQAALLSSLLGNSISGAQLYGNAGAGSLISGASAGPILLNAGAGSLINGASAGPILLNAGSDALLGKSTIESLLLNAGRAQLLGNAGSANLLDKSALESLLLNAAVESILRNAGGASSFGNAGIEHLLINAGVAPSLSNAGIESLLLNAGAASSLSNAGIGSLLGKAAAESLLNGVVANSALLGTNVVESSALASSAAQIEEIIEAPVVERITEVAEIVIPIVEVIEEPTIVEIIQAEPVQEEVVEEPCETDVVEASEVTTVTQETSIVIAPQEPAIETVIEEPIVEIVPVEPVVEVIEEAQPEVVVEGCSSSNVVAETVLETVAEVSVLADDVVAPSVESNIGGSLLGYVLGGPLLSNGIQQGNAPLILNAPSFGITETIDAAASEDIVFLEPPSLGVQAYSRPYGLYPSSGRLSGYYPGGPIRTGRIFYPSFSAGASEAALSSLVQSPQQPGLWINKQRGGCSCS